MRFSKYVSPLNIRNLLAYQCKVLMLLGIIMVPPIVVTLIVGEFSFTPIFGVIFIVLTGAGFIGGRYRTADLELKEALAITALSYIIFSAIGAIPFLPVVPYIDGFFEAMSGITTTGLSVIPANALPKSLLFFRSYAQWIGGAGIIVLSLALLLMPGTSAFHLYSSERMKENLVGSFVSTARIVLKVYLILTALCLMVYLAFGMGAFDAVIHVLSTISTGGFSTYPESIAHYPPPYLSGAVIIFMVLSSISFPLYYQSYREGLRRFFRDYQLRVLVLLIVIASLINWGLSGWGIDDLITSIFNSTSSITTTGFTATDVSSWSEQNKMVSIILMLIGGSAGSTAGGIKLYRIILMFSLIIWLIVKVLLPQEAKIPIKYHNLVITANEMNMVLSFFSFYIVLFFISTLLLSFAGFSIGDSLFESASALGTVGLSSGIASQGLIFWGKLVLIFDMWAGRLEIIPLFIIIFLLPGWNRRQR